MQAQDTWGPRSKGRLAIKGRYRDPPRDAHLGKVARPEPTAAVGVGRPRGTIGAIGMDKQA